MHFWPGACLILLETVNGKNPDDNGATYRLRIRNETAIALPLCTRADV
jgi:hypothetical protein